MFRGTASRIFSFDGACGQAKQPLQSNLYHRGDDITHPLGRISEPSLSKPRGVRTTKMATHFGNIPTRYFFPVGASLGVFTFLPVVDEKIVRVLRTVQLECRIHTWYCAYRVNSTPRGVNVRTGRSSY